MQIYVNKLDKFETLTTTFFRLSVAKSTLHLFLAQFSNRFDAQPRGLGDRLIVKAIE